MFIRRPLFVALAFACAVAAAMPARAGFLNELKLQNLTKHVPPTPPPAHRKRGWDWVGQPDWLTTRPRMTGISTLEMCSWVDYHKPFHWRFVVQNDTKQTVTFDWKPFVYQKNVNLFINDQLIQHVTLKPKQWSAQDVNFDLGCPNMRGGQNNNYYYYVIGDNIRFGSSSQYARSGFFRWWNDLSEQIARDDEEIREQQESEASGAMDAISAGLSMDNPEGP